MRKLLSPRFPLRLLWVPLLVLWAILLQSGEALADIKPFPGSLLAVENITTEAEDSTKATLSTINEDAANDATVPLFGTSLPLVTLLPTAQSFLAPVNEAIPPYAARAPGKSFISLISPIIIQPNAP